MDFVSFRPDESQSTLPGDTLLSSKFTKIDSKNANYEKKNTYPVKKPQNQTKSVIQNI
jgi:hypothetical protein